jgi:hypothetical protein
LLLRVSGCRCISYNIDITKWYHGEGYVNKVLSFIDLFNKTKSKDKDIKVIISLIFLSKEMLRKSSKLESPGMQECLRHYSVNDIQKCNVMIS